jgi:AcrR family transcriptional regulator
MIRRATAVEAALDIIDTDGLEAFSLQRLANRLGVRVPSLYYHFVDKEDILAAVARYIAGKSVPRPRQPPNEEWPEYFVALALNFRESVLRHRNAAPILLRYLPREILADGYEDAARLLADAGVPVQLHARILDGLETLSIGAVLIEAAQRPRRRKAGFPGVKAETHPHLAAALAGNDQTVKALYADRIRNFLRGISMTNAPSLGQTSASFFGETAWQSF